MPASLDELQFLEQGGGARFTLKAGGQAVFAGDVELKGGTTTADGNIAFDRTNEDLSVGDGTASQVVHMGAWKTWTPVFTGFSVDPIVNSARYIEIGKLVIVHLNTGNGTSNATTFTMTLPIVAANTSRQHIPLGTVTDAGVSVAGGVF